MNSEIKARLAVLNGLIRDEKDPTKLLQFVCKSTRTEI